MFQQFLLLEFEFIRLQNMRFKIYSYGLVKSQNRIFALIFFVRSRFDRYFESLYQSIHVRVYKLLTFIAF